MSGRYQPKGIVLINKPRGMTSFGVVSRLRKLIGIRKIGHCGTLDPFAEGLLPVCIGRATAAIQFMDKYDKTYLVQIVFGRATDTMDTEGQTIAEHAFSVDELETLSANGFAALRQSVEDMIGVSQQTPPMYSAVKIDGKPLYSYAREGKTIERTSRRITVYDANITDIECNTQSRRLSVKLRVSCSKGTYIRVLADELGRRLGFYAYAQSLVREKCGPYTIASAVDIEDLFEQSRKLQDQESFVESIRTQGILLEMASAFANIPGLSLDIDETRRMISGQMIPVEAHIAKQLSDGYDDILAIFYEKDLIAAARIVTDEYNSKQLKTERVFVDLEAFRSL